MPRAVQAACKPMPSTQTVPCCCAETKGVPLEEIADLWRAHWYWRRFTQGAERSPRDTELAAGPKLAAAPVPAKQLPAPAAAAADPSCYYTI